MAVFILATSAFILAAVIIYLLVLRIKGSKIQSSNVSNTDNNAETKITQSAKSPNEITTRTEVVSSESRPTEKDISPGWKCACEGGGIFLPASLMKNLAGPGAALRLGAGSCYHKQM